MGGRADSDMTIIDISRGLSEQTPVWPGDQPVQTAWTLSIDKGDNVNVGAVRLSLHAGTHADAPFHFQPDGDTVDRLPLETYMGPATVIEVNSVDVIQPQDLEEAVDTLDSELRPRVLLRTVCSEMPEMEWPEAFPAISPAAVRWLDEHNTVLIGTDAPSVDPQESRALPAHHAIWQSGMAILEHLDLRNAAPGPYQLIALPLRLEGMDAAPVRAVLVQV